MGVLGEALAEEEHANERHREEEEAAKQGGV
jgi:hypothetical protein